jgi:transcriptional regulator with XRE-family HTH domain
MNNFLGLNIKYLRRVNYLTQDQFADKIGVNRAMIGSYEEGRAIPKLTALQDISHYFNVSIDDLVNTDLSSDKKEGQRVDLAGKGLRILTTLVDRDNKELITLVPVKASAGYMKG